MAGFRRVIAQVEQSAIAAQAVSADKTRYHLETGIGTLPTGTRYVVYTTAFGTRPTVRIIFAGTTARMAAGTARLSYDITSSRPGSFRWIGTPSVRARWEAVGVRG